MFHISALRNNNVENLWKFEKVEKMGMKNTECDVDNCHTQKA